MLFISLPLSLALALLISLPRCLPLSLSLSLSLSNLIADGVDICAMLQQRLHHVYVPVMAGDGEGSRALSTREEDKRVRISFVCLLGGCVVRNAVLFGDIYC